MKDGYVIKSKSNSLATEQDLSLINNFTRRKLTQDEVYVFSVVLCDNNIDREHERFTDKALEKLEKLFVGKTGILDHNPTSENQTARIFKCQLESVSGKKNSLGEQYKRLVAKAYMPKSAKNENIIPVAQRLSLFTMLDSLLLFFFSFPFLFFNKPITSKHV